MRPAPAIAIVPDDFNPLAVKGHNQPANDNFSAIKTEINDRRDFYVYAWLRASGEPFYIGKGRGRRAGKVRSGRNKLFNNTIAKIRREGEEPRVIRWHDGLREDDAFRLEAAYIKLFGRRNNGTGILANMTDGGEGASGVVVGEETRTKIGASRLGKTHDDEARAKIRAVAGNRSAETRAKMSASQIGKSPSEETRIKLSVASASRTFSEEHRERLRASGRMLGPRSGFKGVTFKKATGKWVAQIGLDGKRTHIGTFKTAEEAARAYDAAAFAAWGRDCFFNFPDHTHEGETA